MSEHDDELVIEARPHAGHVTLKTAAGETKRLAIAVLDLPTWEQYNDLAEKAVVAGRALVRMSNEREKAEKDGREYQPSEKDSRAANESLVQTKAQLKFFLPELLDEDLKGIDLSKCQQMLQFCVKKAASHTPDETAEEKKTEPVNGTATLA